MVKKPLIIPLFRSAFSNFFSMSSQNITRNQAGQFYLEEEIRNAHFHGRRRTQLPFS
ncbi:hypothetical protein PGB90_004480 [Kerria lacca]